MVTYCFELIVEQNLVGHVGHAQVVEHVGSRGRLGRAGGQAEGQQRRQPVGAGRH